MLELKIIDIEIRNQRHSNTSTIYIQYSGIIQIKAAIFLLDLRRLLNEASLWSNQHPSPTAPGERHS